MKAKTLLRISAGCLLFFAVGHSIGHFTRHKISDPKAKEVLQIMTDNKFDMFGQMRSYDENYTGMSLNLIFCLLALVAILWVISCNVDSQPRFAMHLLLAITFCVLSFGITSILYFFMMPAVTCFVSTVLLLICIMKLKSIL